MSYGLVLRSVGRFDGNLFSFFANLSNRQKWRENVEKQWEKLFGVRLVFWKIALFLMQTAFIIRSLRSSIGRLFRISPALTPLLLIRQRERWHAEHATDYADPVDSSLSCSTMILLCCNGRTPPLPFPPAMSTMLSQVVLVVLPPMSTILWMVILHIGCTFPMSTILWMVIML